MCSVVWLYGKVAYSTHRTDASNSTTMHMTYNSSIYVYATDLCLL